MMIFEFAIRVYQDLVFNTNLSCITKVIEYMMRGDRQTNKRNSTKEKGEEHTQTGNDGTFSKSYVTSIPKIAKRKSNQV